MVRSKLLSYTLIVNSLSGYWPKDYYQLNPNFGTADDLKNLVKALHDRDMYLMVDLVVNHYASWGDEDIQWSQYVPFNDQKYFHNKCWINWNNQQSIEDVRLHITISF